MPDWTTRKAQDASAETAPATVDADIFGWDSDEEVDAEVAALTASPVAFRGYKSASKARPSAPPLTNLARPSPPHAQSARTGPWCAGCRRSCAGGGGR